MCLGELRLLRRTKTQYRGGGRSQAAARGERGGHGGGQRAAHEDEPEHKNTNRGGEGKMSQNIKTLTEAVKVR
jgi:hypothetical protein